MLNVRYIVYVGFSEIVDTCLYCSHKKRVKTKPGATKHWVHSDSQRCNADNDEMQPGGGFIAL